MVLLLAACTPAPQPGHEVEPPATTHPTVSPPDPTSPVFTSPTCTAPGPVAVTALTGDDPHVLENDRRVVLTLDAPAPAALLCVASDDATDAFVLESRDPSDAHEFHLQALRNDATYDCAAGPTCPAGPAQALKLTIGPADPAFDPKLTVTGTPPHGWLLLGVETGGCIGPGAAAIFDPEGRLRWDYPLAYTGMDYELTHLGGGVILMGGHTEGPGPVQLQTWDGVQWAADLPGDAFFNHDVQPLDDGRVLVLEARDAEKDGYSWTGFGLRAFDPATMVVDYDWDSQVAVDQGALAPGYGDAWHANWIWRTDHGQGTKIYVSLCESQQVMRIDEGTGRVDWVMGVGGDWSLEDPDGNALPDSEFTQCQHGLELSPDGSDLLAYDNGRQRGESRVVEYTLDQDALVATETRQWTDGFYENMLGDTDWMPDGTVLVTVAHSECYHPDGDRSAVVQVDLDSGEERWRASFDDVWMATYRSELVPGCDLFGNVGQCPALQDRWDALAPAFGL